MDGFAALAMTCRRISRRVGVRLSQVSSGSDAIYLSCDLMLRMDGKQVIKALQVQGFVILRVSGSHHILGNGQRKVTVPVHGAADLRLGTLRTSRSSRE